MTNVELLQASKFLPRMEACKEWGKYAENDIEKALIPFLVKLHDPKLLAEFENPEEKKFLLRCHFVPEICKQVLAVAAKFPESKRDAVLWFWELVFYAVAHERMRIELVLRRSEKSGISSYCGKTWYYPTTKEEIRSLPAPDIDWFKMMPEGREFWRKKFDAWYEGSRNSFLRYWAERYPKSGIFDLRSTALTAAVYGLVESICPLPPDHVGELIRKLLKGSGRAGRYFYRNAANSFGNDQVQSANKNGLQLDTWLIEIWPIVTSESWNFLKIYSVACMKFPWLQNFFTNPSLQKRRINSRGTSYRSIEARCDKLGLSLSTRAAAGGRPPKSPRNAGNQDGFELVALAIEPVAANWRYWMKAFR